MERLRVDYGIILEYTCWITCLVPLKLSNIVKNSWLTSIVLYWSEFFKHNLVQLGHIFNDKSTRINTKTRREGWYIKTNHKIAIKWILGLKLQCTLGSLNLAATSLHTWECECVRNDLYQWVSTLKLMNHFSGNLNADLQLQFGSVIEDSYPATV